jgi:transcriptional regulator with XRE-family HTH domain
MEVRVKLMDREERRRWRLKRIEKEIRLKELSEYIGCTGNMISIFEASKGNFSPEKLTKYKEFIESH